MIIGFMGKGGSGKTTLSYRFISYLLSQEYQVLAIDGDHNMDLLYNLGVTTPFPYLGNALNDIKRSLGLSPQQPYTEGLLRQTTLLFHLDPIDAFTDAYSLPIHTRLRLMATGPHTESVFHGQACSHILSTPLKLYLPLLELKKQQAVVYDMTAGMDAVSTGIPTGLDMVFICSEPTVHGLKVAKQLAEALVRYDVPTRIILNKTHGSTDEQRLVQTTLGRLADHTFAWQTIYAQPQQKTSVADEKTFLEMTDAVHSYLHAHGTERLARSQQKILRNQSYTT